MVVCNFGIIGSASSTIHIYSISESVTVIAKVQESLVLADGIISFILGNAIPSYTGRYPLWLSIFGVLITSISLAVRVDTTGFYGDTSKIGIVMPSHKVAANLMIISLVVWMSLINFEFDIEITTDSPFVKFYDTHGFPVAVNDASITENSLTVTRNYSVLSRASTLPRYTPPEELPLYTKNPVMPHVYEDLDIRSVEPAVISEESRHENHNEGESSIQLIYSRYTPYLGRS